MSQAQLDQERKAKELAEQLTNFVNNFNCDHDAFINAFCNQHRTLQQSSFRLILMLIEKMGSDEYRTDGRNEGSKKVAKQLIEGFKKEVIKDQMSQGVSEEEATKFAETDYAKPHGYLGYV